MYPHSIGGRSLAAFFAELAGDPEHEHVAAVDAVAVERALDSLSPRQRQTLRALLFGQSEKQIAYSLRRSQHTVHEYVKVIYRRFAVDSRAQLMSLLLRANPYISLDGSAARAGRRIPLRLRARTNIMRPRRRNSPGTDFPFLFHPPARRSRLRRGSRRGEADTGSG